jgi:RNA polymerase sigma factor (sigma-70 family)
MQINPSATVNGANSWVKCTADIRRSMVSVKICGMTHLGERLHFKKPPVAIPNRMNAPGPELLGRLLDEHASALTLFARQWCSTPEDVVQEAFVQLARQSECPRDTVAWLYRVVRNGAISAGRAESRRRRHEAQAAAIAGDWFAKEAVDMALDARAASVALNQLAPEELEVVVAHVWGGLTFAQIAQLVSSTTSTVHRRYQSGLMNLKKLLGEPCLPKKTSTQNCPKS